MTPKLDRREALRWDKTHIFAKHTCFYMFWAGWPEGGPWEGGKGGGIMNPRPERSNTSDRGSDGFGPPLGSLEGHFGGHCMFCEMGPFK